MNRPLATAIFVVASALPNLALAQSISKVNGRVEVAANQSIDDISTVNGTVNVGSNATVKGDVSVVNGTVTIDRGAKVGDVSAVNGAIRAGEQLQALEMSTVNGGIEVGAVSLVKKDVTSVNGGILLHRGTRVSGDVTTVNGAIGLIATTVEGDVESVNGNMTVGLRSVVEGDVVYRAPKGISISFRKVRIPVVIIGPHAQVKGKLTFERDVRLYVHDTAKIGPVTGARAIAFSGNKPDVN